MIEAGKSTIFGNPKRMIGSVICTIWWVPTVTLWIVFAPMLTVLEYLTFIFFDDAKNLSWRWAGMTVQMSEIEPFWSKK